jgi:hypothetical protein
VCEILSHFFCLYQVIVPIASMVPPREVVLVGRQPAGRLSLLHPLDSLVSQELTTDSGAYAYLAIFKRCDWLNSHTTQQRERERVSQLATTRDPKMRTERASGRLVCRSLIIVIHDLQRSALRVILRSLERHDGQTTKDIRCMARNADMTSLLEVQS